MEAIGIKAKAAEVLARMGVDPQEALTIARVTMGPVKMAPKPEPIPPMRVTYSPIRSMSGWGL